MPVKEDHAIFVQAHRGAGAGEPENTLESCLATWSLSPQLIPELDISTTADGVIVGFHDRDLTRLVRDLEPALSGKSLHELTWQQACQFDVGAVMGPRFAHRHMVRVSDAFAEMAKDPRRRLYLDYKHAPLSQLARLVRDYTLEERVILATNHHDLIQQWRQLIPAAQTLLWVSPGAEGGLEAAIDRARRAGFAGITQLQIHTGVSPDGSFAPCADYIQSLVRELGTAGIVLQAFPYTGRFAGYTHPDAFVRLLELGVRSFATDYPQEALEAVGQYLAGRRMNGVPMRTSIETMDLRDKGWQTQSVTLGDGVLTRVEAVYEKCFGNRPAVIVADANTFAAAGDFLCTRLARCGRQPAPIILCGEPTVHADMPTVDYVQQQLAVIDATPIALGSGTINDVVKLASHRLQRPYMIVGTAASMDGYTAFGASITEKGSKQTFDCPAPRALLADMDVVAAAPAHMAATGYADLLAKVASGADWLIADALGVEPLNDEAWQLVQFPLRQWMSQPEGIRAGSRAAVRNLMEGLVASGLAMQVTKNSRPASGAEHQFSHLWDMENHLHNGQPVPHGSKVGIGTLASCGLYESLLQLPLEKLNIEARCRQWPTLQQFEERIAQLHSVPALREKSLLEMRAKYVGASELRRRLERLRAAWPELSQKLCRQLLPTRELRDMLRAAGAPAWPQEIGITPARLRESYYRAWPIRRRYTIFDLAMELGVFDDLVTSAFLPGGVWAA